MNSNLLRSLWEKFTAYQTWLQKQALSSHTKRAYKSRLNHFLVYLATADEYYDDVLQSEQTRDRATRNYKAYLKEELRASASTINTTLATIDHFYRFLGVASPQTHREESTESSSSLLTEEEQQHLLVAVDRCRSTKYRALALLLMHSGITVGECAALNVSDLFLDAANASVLVKSSRKNRTRQIGLPDQAAHALANWISERAAISRGTNEPALFLNRSGGRITTAGIDLIIRKLGRAAGLELSVTILRRTFLTRLLLSGNDVRTVARIGGHKRLETTRRYSLPAITICEEPALDPSPLGSDELAI